MDDTLSYLNQKWAPRRAPAPPPELSEAGRFSPRLARLLAARGVRTAAEAESFLDPGLHRLSDPLLIPRMDAAVARVAAAIRRGEPVVIYGDYDVDGQASAALLWRVIRDLGGKASTYIPNRLAEGYGLHLEALERLKREGATLVLTVDCGVTAVREAAWAAQHGLDLVITDHHEPGDAVPAAIAVVNPKLGAPAALQGLAGAGVAFKLAEALGDALGRGRDVAHRYVELAALGTIADVVPLLGENRSIAAAGLRRLNRGSQIPGLAALKSVARIEGEVTPYHVAFGLAPRLNAAGRIADASAGVELLTSDDPGKARAIAERLDCENEERRRIERQIDEEADRFIRERCDPERDLALVAWGEGWHPGVIGIVAARIVERYFRPTVILAVEGGLARGSARGVPGLNLYDALSECGELFEAFGGHEGAAGMTLKVERLEAFRERFHAAVSERLGGRAPVPVLEYDDAVDLSELSFAFAEEILRLGPFGVGNPAPVFVAEGVELRARPVGRDQSHLKFAILPARGFGELEGIGFGLADKVAPNLAPGRRYDVALTPRISEWNGLRTLTAEVKDVRAAAGAAFTRVGAQGGPRSWSVVDRRGVEPARVLGELAGSGGPAYVISGPDGGRLAEHIAAMGLTGRIAVADGPGGLRPADWVDRAVAEGRGRVAAALMEIPADLRELALRLEALVAALSRAGAALDFYLAFPRDVGAAFHAGLASRFPDRERLGRLYVALRSEIGPHEPFTPGRAFGAVERKWPGVLAPEGVRRGIEVFAELGLLVREGGRYRLMPQPGAKVDLEGSLRYNECTRIRERLLSSRKILAETPPEQFMSTLRELSEELGSAFAAGRAAGG